MIHSCEHIKNLIVIGSSTGGPRVLNSIFTELPRLDACILIVQHVPPVFDKVIAERLNGFSPMTVKLAAEGDILRNSSAYFAPALTHMKLVGNRTINLVKGEKINCCIPSVDATMTSLRNNPKGKIIGVMLTGMGSDGADGMVHIKDLGGKNIAQNKESCTIYGMPKAAVDTGTVDYILHDNEIPSKLIALVGTVD